MSFDREPLTFYCDGVLGHECKTKRVFVYGTSFVDARRKLSDEHWRSLKRLGGAWLDFCPDCGPMAEIEHNEFKRQEEARERTKARNAQ